MPRLSAIDAINPAFERMKVMLFRPFRFKTWLKIGFIGWLAGAGSGGFNLNLPSSPGGGGSSGSTTSQDVERAIRVFFSEHLFLIALMVALAILIGLGFFYLSCRFRFILFDSILQKDPQINRGWQRYASQAHRYFGFLICFGIACALVLAAIVGLPLWRAYKSGVFKSGNPFPALFGYLIPIFLGVLLFVVVVAIITTLVNDFIVPILALDGATIGGAWSRLERMIAVERGAFAGYLGMKLLLSIMAAIAVLIPFVVIVLILFIPGVIVVIAGVAIAKTVGPALGIVLAVIGGLAALALLILATMLATAPVVVFFTSYAFYFFGGRYPRLGALLWPQAPPPLAQPPLVPPPPPAVPGAAPAM